MGRGGQPGRLTASAHPAENSTGVSYKATTTNPVNQTPQNKSRTFHRSPGMTDTAFEETKNRVTKNDTTNEARFIPGENSLQTAKVEYSPTHCPQPSQ